MATPQSGFGLQCSRGSVASEIRERMLGKGQVMASFNVAEAALPRKFAEGSVTVTDSPGCFNVAEAALPRKSSYFSHGKAVSICFNVAEAALPRKWSSIEKKTSASSTLQCSRGSVASEIFQVSLQLRLLPRLLQCSRGSVASEIARPTTPCRVPSGLQCSRGSVASEICVAIDDRYFPL